MTQEELISHFCDYRGKCTTDDVAALTFAYRMLAPRWISVEDELPPIDEKSFNGDWSINVLVAGTDDDTIGIDFYDYGHNEWVSSIDPITHWMPMPKPPKKGGEL